MNERQPQRTCGCVGIFFQLFDRNGRFAKKLLSLAFLKQASNKFGGDEKQPKLRLITDENSGGFLNAKNNGMTNTRCESRREMKAPSLVARLIDKLGARPGGFDKEDMDFEMAEIKSLEPDLISTRRSCRELIHNVYGVLRKIDQLKGSKLSYAKQVILNDELIFGTTPQQKALPVEDRFSVRHFLLNEHEMFLTFLWMAFGELLGCNDPKQMNQLKEFTFDCLLEYLDSKFSRVSDSGFRTCTKLPSSMTKEILIADIIDEVEERTQFVGLIPDELIELDMSHSLGNCMDFEIE
ncbi:hypothetical protein CQW23_30774 [Capsicum baccatum]|uniref:DUF4378 domain-containing protein n=1 Tax=Capsicum baccatum TaxID=33114 RepID=A0A2G2V9G9_CAPBA|nr:hypothetical protein CQW23_30774 [Capsicum baccatum]